MIRFWLKAPKLTGVFLCLALAVPTGIFAQIDATPQLNVSENSAAAADSKVTRNPGRPGATPQAQLLDQEEIAALSQRNQNPGPEVRGGALSNEHLTYIVIALAAIVLVLILR